MRDLVLDVIAIGAGATVLMDLADRQQAYGASRAWVFSRHAACR